GGAEFRRVDQQRSAERGREHARQRDGAGGEQPRDRFAARVRERDHVAADCLAGEASRIGGPDRRADGTAGNRDRTDADLVERLDDDDVGKPACPAAAERKAERLARALGPSARGHLAPAARANSQAFAAIGRTICARAGATSLVALPSRTRPTMPWIIAVMRKKL